MYQGLKYYVVHVAVTIAIVLLCSTSARAIAPNTLKYRSFADPYTPFEKEYLEEYKAKKWRMHTAIHNFRSFLDDRQFSFFGLKGGLEYKKRYRFGLMLLGQQEAVMLNDQEEDRDYELSEVAYLAGYGEYMIINNYRWELGIPISFGRGGGRVVTLNQNEEQIGEPEELTFNALQMGLYGQYNINYWLGFGLGAGHRSGFSTDVKVRDFVSTPYYTFGLKINLGRLLKSVFAHEKVKAEKKLYFESRKKK
jgi:hypothetical protein